MRPRDYFPLGMAYDEAFCNRIAETELLLENIKHGKHTLLMAPRRYGKSSLVMHVLSLANVPYVETDFYMASSEKIIETYLLKAVVDLIGKALGPAEKLITSIKRYVKNLKPKLEITQNGLSLELGTDAATDPATNVMEALYLLEQLLAEKKQRAVLSLDEFQNVGVIAQGKGIEGAIRHIAQKTKYLTFIFSGSNRKLLKTMFDDESRPLYKLCWKLNLKRIEDEHYREHMKKPSMMQWKHELSDEAFETIINLTEKHPFYVNKLCDRIWVFCDKVPPSVSEINAQWSQIIEEEKSDAVKEISLLSPGQKNVLLHVASNPAIQLTSKDTIIALDMPSSSILASIEGLEEKDMIEKDNINQIINPVVKHYVLLHADLS